MEKLVQVRVNKDIKAKADKVFETYGISSQVAIKIFLISVAKSGTSPFEGLFNGKNNLCNHN